MLYHQSILFPKFYAIDEFVCEFLEDAASADCCRIAEREDDLAALKNPRVQKWLQFENFVIFGIGGSSLGGQTIHALSGKKNIKFCNNLDADTLEKLFQETNFSSTGFLCISKSGETLETICQTIFAIEKAKQNCENYREHFLIITEDKKSSLKEIAFENDFICLDHPKTTGGRFSVFSLVGMVPTILCDIDPLKIRAGGRQVLNDLKNETSKVLDGASFLYECYRKNLRQHVSFIYSDKMRFFGKWVEQLYAESSGKKGEGITPITAVGSVDQHSQLQLYLDGPSDKCFSFFIEKQQSDLVIESKKLPQNFSYLCCQKITEIFSAQYEATSKVLIDKEYPVRKIEIEQLNAESLGALFMHFMLETICFCYAIKVNPFDQPAVEKGKIITADLLGGTNAIR